MSKSLLVNVKREKNSIDLRKSLIGFERNLYEVMGGKEGLVFEEVSTSGWYSFFNFRIFRRF